MALEVGEQARAQVELDRQAQLAGHPAAHGAQHEAQRADRSTTAQTSGASAPRSPAVEDVVDHPSGQVWQGDGARHQARGADRGDRDLAGVGPQEAEQAEENVQGDSPVNDREGPRGPQGRGALLDDDMPPAPAPPDRVRRARTSARGATRRPSGALVDACRLPRVRVLDVHSDPDHHRSVITLAGEPLAVQDALVALAGECVNRIDLRRHRGAHPRTGALDVAPIVALADDDIPFASEVALGLAGRLGDGAQPAGLPLRRRRHRSRAHPPARLPPRRARRARRGWSTRARSCPTPGPHRVHPSAGVVLVGVRSPLIALNVWLPDGTLTEARAIAARVRESGGGPAGRARPRPLPARGRHGPGVDEHRGPPRGPARGRHRAPCAPRPSASASRPATSSWWA